MCEGISYAKRIVEKWIVSHMESYPPVVINITDGESTDGNPLSNAKDIAQLKTNDGNILFLNCHISSHKAASIIFPDSSAGLPDQYAKLLFDMSSILPEPIINTAQKEGYNLSNQSRGFAFNTDLVELIRFLDIGTKRNLRRIQSLNLQSYLNCSIQTTGLEQEFERCIFPTYFICMYKRRKGSRI